jgi:hypothetical protein
LTQGAGEQQRPAIALELLRTLFAVRGGLRGAEPFFKAAAQALTKPRGEVYEECSNFATSLSQEYIDRAVEELIPAAPVLRALGGPDTIEGIGHSIALLHRWWGKRNASEPGGEPFRNEPRFEWPSTPDTEQDTALELLTILAGKSIFDAADAALAAIRSAADRDSAWRATAEQAVNKMLAQYSAAGNLDRCDILLKQVRSLSDETARDLTRAYIKYGRLHDALSLFLKIVRRSPAENLWPAGFEIIEALVAEDLVREAVDLFRSIGSRGVSMPACDAFADSSFALGNAVLKSGNRSLLRDFLTLLTNLSCSAEVRRRVRDRLAGYAEVLARQDDPARAEWWRRFSEEFRKGWVN